MQLPHLKKKWPRVANPMPEMSYGTSASEKLDEYCMDELFEAAKSKNVSQLREALEALILNCFDHGLDNPGGPNAVDSGKE
jgi:hypothetical protein